MREVNMTKYKVSFHTWYELEADDDEEAFEDAFDMLGSGNLDEGWDYTIEKVVEQDNNPHEPEIKHDFFLLALGNFVCETPPLDIREWPDEKADAWIEEHAWQPFENWSARDIWREAFDLERQFDAVKDKLLANANTTKELANAEVGA
jgi:hypothetical protein